MRPVGGEYCYLLLILKAVDFAVVLDMRSKNASLADDLFFALLSLLPIGPDFLDVFEAY